jgi:hypothetical protein
MTADPTGDRAAQGRLLVSVEGSRELGPAEAESILRECLALTHKRFDAALWPALELLQAAAPEELDYPPSMAPAPPGDPELVLAQAVRARRAEFIPKFKSVFDQLFERRREGKRRTRGPRDASSFTLAIVDHGDHTAQVALKSAVSAMRAATIEDAFALDSRVRLLLREAPSDTAFDNPWSTDYICDAFGTVCRELWPDGQEWRPIMEQLVRVTTPEIAALHRELNALLRDRDVLPALRMRVRAGADGAHPQGMGSRALLDKLMEKLQPGGQLPPGIMAGVGALPAGDGSGSAAAAGWPPDAQVWSTLVGALTALQRGQVVSELPELARIDPEAARSGSSNELTVLKAAVAGRGGSPVDRLTIDVVEGVLDYVFDDRYIAEEIKTVLGRLQIPILKAALLDRRVLADAQHPARRLFDTLAAAGVDLNLERPRDRALIELANSIAARIRDEFDEDLGIFETVRSELDAFLDSDRASANEQVAAAVEPLVAQDKRAAARDDAAVALEARIAGRDVPPEIRAFLDHECVERLATVSLEQGTESKAWSEQLALVDDLLWSITPKFGAAARKRLAEMLPRMLARIKKDWATDEAAQARREALLSRLFALHVASMKAAPPEPWPTTPGASGTATPGVTPIPPGAPATVPAAAPRVVTPPSAASVVASRAPDAHERQVMALVRGDWCSFKTDGDGEPVIARLAWRAPQRQRLLFCHRDGSTAFVYSPESLAEAFRSGRAQLAVEAIPLFDRAMGRLIEKIDEAPRPAA